MTTTTEKDTILILPSARIFLKKRELQTPRGMIDSYVAEFDRPHPFASHFSSPLLHNNTDGLETEFVPIPLSTGQVNITHEMLKCIPLNILDNEVALAKSYVIAEMITAQIQRELFSLFGPVGIFNRALNNIVNEQRMAAIIRLERRVHEIPISSKLYNPDSMCQVCAKKTIDTVAFAKLEDKRIVMALACQSPVDNFCKKTGRDIAGARLIEFIKYNKANPDFMCKAFDEFTPEAINEFFIKISRKHPYTTVSLRGPYYKSKEFKRKQQYTLDECYDHMIKIAERLVPIRIPEIVL